MNPGPPTSLCDLGPWFPPLHSEDDKIHCVVLHCCKDLIIFVPVATWPGTVLGTQEEQFHVSV